MVSAVWSKVGGVLKRYGYPDEGTINPDPDPGTNSRDLLVYGTYEPDASTTGVLPGTVLTDYEGTTSATNTYTFPRGMVVTDKKIYGDIRPPTNGEEVILQNCLIVGGNHIPTNSSGVVDCNSARPGTGRLILIDCTIEPRVPALNRDCIVGHRYNAYRCNMSKGIDGIGIFIETSKGTSASVRAYGNYVHDLVYIYPDYINGVSGAARHTDGTHNDNVQIQGGNNIHVWGNALVASSYAKPGTGTNPEKPWLLSGGKTWLNGATVIIQKQGGTAPLDNTVIVEENWIGTGLSAVNMKPGAYIVRNNLLTQRVAPNGPQHGGYWFRGDNRSTTTVTGLTTNRWEDTNAVIAEPRTSGIHWNA